MRLDLVTPERAPLAERIPDQWRRPLVQLALAWAAVFALFAADWAAMAWHYWNSSTYNHILLVPAILGWLVWQRAPQLAELTPKSWWPGLVPLAGALFVWLLGDISGVAVAKHLGVVVALQALVITMMGPRVSWALFFPICYAFFLVPIGDEMVPALQMITADITIWLTVASGIPAHIEGVFIDTPAGLFEVAEACSGVKFLIAMIALGTLVAHVCFASWKRRAAFMALAVALPILANGVRAWGTIYIAQSQGIRFAAGFDHIFYGWIFFALVMAALLGIGWKFFDRKVEEPFINADAIATNPHFERVERFAANGWQLLAAVFVLSLGTLVWSVQVRGLEAELPANPELPAVEGWTRIAGNQAYPWTPRMSGADQRLSATYEDAEGRVIEVVYANYAAQSEGREAGAFGEGALPPDTEWRWLSASVAADGAAGERLQALGMHRRVAETWFHTGSYTGQSTVTLKLLTMKDRLFLTARPTATLIISAEEQPGVDAVDAIADFRSSTGDLGEWMDRASSVD